MTTNDRTRALLVFLREYHRANQCSPSIRDMRDAIHTTSTNAVRTHLNRLEEGGFIRRTSMTRTRRASRSVVITGHGWSHLP